MKLGISLKIDVTKIDKARIHEGAKGKYVDLTAFIDTENAGQYGDNGFISQSVTREEKEQGVKLPILGNVKVFWKQAPDPNNISDQQRRPQAPPPPPPFEDDGESIDDVPF